MLGSSTSRISKLGRIQAWCRRHPLVWPAVVTCTVLAAVHGMSGWVIGSYAWLAVALFIFLVGLFLDKRGAVIGLVFSLIIGWFHAGKLASREEMKAHVEQGDRVEFSAVVVQQLNGKRCIVKVEESSHLPTGVRLVVREKESWREGDVIECSGWLRGLREARNPGDFDERNWLSQLGGTANFYGEQSKSDEGKYPYRLRADFTDVRSSVVEKISDGIEEENRRKVIASMFLGQRQGAAEVMADFRLSGTLHVFAVSGLHVMMIGGIAHLVCRVFQLSRYIWVPLVIGSMLFYAGVTGFGSPAVRAVLMAGIFLMGYFFLRKPNVLNSMAASALIVLLYDSDQLFTVGFQLSYLVVLSIVLLSHWWGKRLAFIHYVEPFLPRSLYSRKQEVALRGRKWVSGSLAVSCAAWMGSAPLIGGYFKLCTPIAIALGLPMVVGLFSVIALSCLSLCVGSVHAPLGKQLNRINGTVAGASHWMASWGAEQQHVSFQEDFSEELVVFDRRGGATQYLGFGGGVLLDVGEQADLASLLNALAYSKLDSVLLSHADIKHCEAIAELSESREIKQVAIPVLQSSSYRVRQHIQQIDQANVIAVKQADHLELEPGVSLEILYNGADKQGVNADDKGLVVLLHWHGQKVLFMSDAGFYVQQYLIENKLLPKVDLVVLGKHKMENEWNHDFFEAIAAKALIATDSRVFDEGRSVAWKHHAKQYCKDCYLLSETGAVRVRLKEGRLQFVPHIMHGKDDS